MSFNLDVDTLMSGASQMFNALWPVFAIVVGLGLGIKLIQLVRSEISKVV